MIDLVIDWPNLILGALLGFALGLILWLLDRHRAKRERALDARAEWMKAAKQIELAVGPQTTAGEFYVLRASHVVDRWRSILGPDDFVLLDRLESSFQQAEGMGRRFKEQRTAENWALLQTALSARAAAFVAFANMSRAMQSESYSDVLRAEARTQYWRDFKRRPIRTWRQNRRNEKAQRLASPL
jgi:hypothetical protein